MALERSFMGYRRENGRAGIRNHVVIMPLDDISNAAAEAVASHIQGTMAKALLEAHYQQFQRDGSDLVFPSAASTLTNFQKCFRNARTRAGLDGVDAKFGERLRMHSLRHGMVSDMLDAGASHLDIMSQCGMTLQTVERYAHAKREHARKGVAKVGARI